MSRPLKDDLSRSSFFFCDAPKNDFSPSDVFLLLLLLILGFHVCLHEGCCFVAVIVTHMFFFPFLGFHVCRLHGGR